MRAPPGAASCPPARHIAPGSAGWPPPADRPRGRYLPQPAGSPGSRPGWAAPPAAPAGTAGPAGRRSTGVSVSLSERCCYLEKLKKKKRVIWIKPAVGTICENTRLGKEKSEQL